MHDGLKAIRGCSARPLARWGRPAIWVDNHWVDNHRVKGLDRYASKRKVLRIVWESALPSGAHTVQLRVLGSESSLSTGRRVDLDALVTLR